jgi:hypothetical protein
MELYLISKFTRKPTNTANFSTTTPHLFHSQSPLL